MPCPPRRLGLAPSRRAVLKLAAGGAAGLSGCGWTGDDDDDTATDAVVLHPLGNGAQVFPESVAVVPDGSFFVGSVKDGTIFRGRLGVPAMDVWSPAGANGRTIANGLFWSNDRLAVLERQNGRVNVYDTRNGALLARLGNGLPPDQTFLNDVVLLPSGDAYITDSTQPVLYKLTAATGDFAWKFEAFLSFDGTPVRYVKAAGAAGINVNGIVATADGRYLLVAKRNDNALYRIDLSTRQVLPVALPAGAIDTPDGLFLDGRTLYVAQNVPRTVAVLRLADDFLAGTRSGTVSDPSLEFPTAVARLRDRLLVVNSQFDRLGSPAAVSGTQPPSLPFTVSELPATV